MTCNIGRILFFIQFIFVGLGLVTVNGFENSKSLFLSVHLIGETPEQQTRLFERNILTKGDYPLDLKVTLKVKR